MVITKKEMTGIVVEKLQSALTQKEVGLVIDALLEGICEQLGEGNNVVFRKYCTFKPMTMKSKIGRNPKKPNETVVIPPKKKVKFIAGSEMMASLTNKQD